MAEFSYFDQLKTTSINLTQLLDKLSTDNNLNIDNKYTFSNIQPIITNLPDLFSKYNVIFEFKNNVDIIIRYEITDDELPDNVSNNIYGTPEYWWVVILFNDMFNPFQDWPMTQTQLVETAKRMFESEAKYSYNTYATLIHEQNEEKRNIILPKKQTLKDIIWKYREAILNGK